VSLIAVGNVTGNMVAVAHCSKLHRLSPLFIGIAFMGIVLVHSDVFPF
jgi:hypothetical protein